MWRDVCIKVELRTNAVVILACLFASMYANSFDEVHFGGFASKYLSRKFFMDVHPPLAKLLITFASWLHGFKGNFDFSEIGNEYLMGADQEPVPYIAMRSVSALFGTLTVPLAYLTLRALALRPASALLGSLLVIFDNALTLSLIHI